ncbi:MAG: hypothetical protein ACK54P_05125, partial [Bacteroidota bacterium]
MFRAIVTLLILTSIFVWSYIFFREPFELYLSYVVYALLFPFFFMRYGVPKRPIYLFIPILIAGITYSAVGLNEASQFWKVFIGFFSSTLFFHYVIQLYNFDIKLLFRYYMKTSVIISLIGLFQLISYTVGFSLG